MEERLDYDEAVELARHIAEQGDEAGFSDEEIAAAKRVSASDEEILGEITGRFFGKKKR